MAKEGLSIHPEVEPQYARITVPVDVAWSRPDTIIPSPQEPSRYNRWSYSVTEIASMNGVATSETDMKVREATLRSGYTDGVEVAAIHRVFTRLKTETTDQRIARQTSPRFKPYEEHTKLYPLVASHPDRGETVFDNSIPSENDTPPESIQDDEIRWREVEGGQGILYKYALPEDIPDRFKPTREEIHEALQGIREEIEEKVRETEGRMHYVPDDDDIIIGSSHGTPRIATLDNTSMFVRKRLPEERRPTEEQVQTAVENMRRDIAAAHKKIDRDLR